MELRYLYDSYLLCLLDIEKYGFTTDFLKQKGKVPLLINEFTISSRWSVMYEAHFFKTKEEIPSSPVNAIPL
jgi:hypothetical protein